MKGSTRKYVDRKCLLYSTEIFINDEEMLPIYIYIYIYIIFILCLFYDYDGVKKKKRIIQLKNKL